MRRGLGMLARALLPLALVTVPAPAAGTAPDREPTVGNLGPDLVHLDAYGDDAGNRGGRPIEELVFPTVFPRGVQVLRDVTVTVDFRSLRGLAGVRERSRGCPRDGRVVTCTFDRLAEGLPPGEYVLRARPGSSPGDEGALRFRATSPDLPRPVTWETRVVIGRPELEVARTRPPRDLAPGDAYAVPIRVVNTGDVPAEGLVVSLSTLGALGLERLGGASCHYPPQQDLRFGGGAYCAFDTVLAPGEAVRMSVPVRVRTGPTLLRGDLDAVASAAGTLPRDVFHPPDFPVTGAGPAARLVPATAGDRTTGLLHQAVRTSGRLDLRAFGDRVRGRVGRTVEVVVGIRNLGPQEVDGFDRPTPYRLVFTPPPGTTVVSNYSLYEDREWECSPQEPGAASYECRSFTSELRAGARQRFQFGLRLDDPDPGAGRVEVFPRDGRLDLRDPDRGNDTASVRVDAHGTAPPAAPADGSGGGPSPWWWVGGGVVALGAVLALRRLLSARA